MRCAIFFVLFACGGATPPPRTTPPPGPQDHCVAGNCTTIGMQLSDQGKLVEARQAFERGCETAIDSCTALALMLLKGEGGPKDERRAAELSERSCNRDDPGGCLIHGLLARDGQGTAKDRDRAIDDFDKACRRGMQQACDAKRELETP